MSDSSKEIGELTSEYNRLEEVYAILQYEYIGTLMVPSQRWSEKTASELKVELRLVLEKLHGIAADLKARQQGEYINEFET